MNPAQKTRDSLFKMVQQMNTVIKNNKLSEDSTRDRTDRDGSVGGTSERKLKPQTFAISSNNKYKHYLLYLDDCVGLPRQFQSMLVKATNDDDYETGVPQTEKAKAFCMNETLDAIEEKQEKPPEACDSLSEERSEDSER